MHADYSLSSGAMAADYRLTGFSAQGLAVYRMHIDGAWIGALHASGFEPRTADVGEAILVTVVAVSPTELRRVNELARTRRSASCSEVDVVLEWAGGSSYYSPWFVIESADID